MNAGKLWRDAQHCAPVLERMLELLTMTEGAISFGDALTRAADELRVVVPRDMEGALIATAFRIIATKKIPGAPDA